jgi:hypothetical protein
MSRTPVRIACLLIGLLATGALGYRAFQDEEQLSRSRGDSTVADAAAEQALQAILDLRASLYAYVAPTQGIAFWSERAAQNLDALRQHLVTLDTATAPIGTSLSETLDGVDQLAAAEQRARSYAGRGETLLAGDVLFTEMQELLSASISQVQDARNVLRRDDQRRSSALREEQAMLAGGAVALWALIAVLLMPVAPKQEPKPAEWREVLAETIKKPIPVAPAAPASSPMAPQAPLAPVAPGVALDSLREAAEICTDLSALADPGALEGALARVSSLLNATGVIVWVASNDGGSLAPVATCGFDSKLVARIGRIARDSANLTASAFRENHPKVSSSTASSPAAIAIALCGPSGPAGVLSIELKAGQEPDAGRVALAGIVAAQLATLAMPIPMTTAPEAAAAKRAAL